MQKKIIGFDLDGVLIDSLPVMEIAWHECMNKLGIKEEFVNYKKHIGKPFIDIMNILGLIDYMPEIKYLYDQKCIENIELINVFPGIANILMYFNSLDSCFVSIVTSKTKARAEHIVDKLNLVSDILITPEDCSKGKPNPDPLLKLNRHFDVRPNSNSSIYIGDMNSDYRSAKSANWHYVNVSWGYGEIIDKNEMEYYSCANINQVSELKRYLSKWLIA